MFNVVIEGKIEIYKKKINLALLSLSEILLLELVFI